MSNTLMGLVASLAAGILALTLVLVSIRRRYVYAVLVGLASVLMGAQIGGAHLFTLVTGVWVLTSFDRRAKANGIWALVLVTSAGLLSITALFGDLVNSRTLALQLIALSCSGAAIALYAGSRDAHAMLRGALTGITAGAGVGLLQVLGVLSNGLWHPDISTIGRPIGIWPEPDWLGLMCALGLVLAWRLELGAMARTLALALNGLGFVLAFARAAWVGLAVSIVMYAALRWIRARKPMTVKPRRGIPTAILMVLLLGAITVNANLRNDLTRRVETFATVSSDDVSGQARLRQTSALLTLASTAAPFGHGLSSSGRVGVWGELRLVGAADNNVSSNWILAMWVDGALLAMPLILLLVGIAIGRAAEISGQLLAVVLVNSLWSNALFLPITWLCVGLVLLDLQRTAPTAIAEQPAAQVPKASAANA